MPRGVKKGVSKFDRAVSKIKRKGGARNPYAVANAKLGKRDQDRAGELVLTFFQS
jgi:hypothetical protein